MITIDRQALLEELMNKEVEKLRKTFFPYKRRKLLRNEVVICEEILEEGIAGQYEKIDVQNDFRFTHKITVSTKIVDLYVNYEESRWGCSKTFRKNELKKTILHEILHGFVMEHYESWGEIKGTHRDASPIFLSLLYFVGIGHHSGHDSAYQFKKSPIYKEIHDIVTFKELDCYLTKLIFEYKKAISKIEKIVDNRNLKCINNKFEFASRKAGLYPYYTVSATMALQDKRDVMVKTNSFQIGCNVAPSMLKNLTNRKIANDSFEIRNHEFYVYEEEKEDAIKVSERIYKEVKGELYGKQAI